MDRIEISALLIPHHNGRVNPAYARLVASDSFTALDGTFVVGGSPADADFAPEAAVTKNEDGSLVLAAFSGDNAVIPTTNSSNPFVTYSLNLYSARGKFLKTLYEDLRVPPENLVTNFDDLDNYSRTRVLPPAQNYPTWEQLYRHLNGLGLVGLGSELLAGALKLDTPAVNPLQPVAVGVNSPLVIGKASDVEIGRVFLDTEAEDPDVPIAVGANSLLVALADHARAGRSKSSRAPLDAENPLHVETSEPSFIAAQKYKYHADYVLLAGEDALEYAIAAIGSEEVIYRISEEVVLIKNYTIPANMRVEFGADGKLNVNADQNVIIENLADPGERKVFYGEGDVLVLAAEIRTAWWETDASVDFTRALGQALASAGESNGGTVLVARGNWTTMGGHTAPSGANIKYGSTNVDSAVAAKITLNPASSEDCIFYVPGGVRSVGFDGITLSVGATGKDCIRIEPTALAIVIDVAVHNCTGLSSNGTGHFINIVTDNGFRQVAQMNVTHCRPIGFGAAIKSNTNNIGFKIDGCIFYIGDKIGIHLVKSGLVKISNTEFAGSGGTIWELALELFDVTTNADSATVVSLDPDFTEDMVGLLAYFPDFKFSTFVKYYVDEYTLILADYPPVSEPSVNVQFKERAASKAGSISIWVEGERSNLSLDNVWDEGIATSLRVDTGMYNYPINTQSCVMQGAIDLRGGAVINSIGDHWRHGQFIDTPDIGGEAPQSFINLIGAGMPDYFNVTNFPDSTSDLAGHRVLRTLAKIDGFVGFSKVINDFAIRKNIINQPTLFTQSAIDEGSPGDPLVEILARENGKTSLRFGRKTGADSFFGYDLGRDGTDGWAELTGNQSGFDGLRLSGGLQIGEGTKITKKVVYAAELTPTPVGANTTAEQSFEVAGVTAADKLTVNAPAQPAGIVIGNIRAGGTNSVEITFGNLTAGNVQPTDGVYQIIAERS